MLPKIHLLLLTLVLLLCLSAFPASIAAAPVPADRDYTLQIELDYPAATLTVHQTLVYTNRSGERLKELRFNVMPAYYQAFSLLGASAGGKPVATSWDKTALILALPQELGDGEQVVANLDYKIVVPRRADRFGVSGGILALGNFYPTIAVYKAGLGWQSAPYVPVGDAFFTEVSDYHVTVKVGGAVDPNTVIIAHTGRLLKHEGANWELAAARVRDFALVASNKFTSSSVDVDGVKIVAYYRPEDAGLGQGYLSVAAQTVRWMNTNVAHYPYSVLNIVEVSSDRSVSVGQEYPTLVMISDDIQDVDAGPAGYFAYLVSHEIVHQWFYSLVGDDQIHEPWLDEALTTQFGYLAIGRLPRSTTATAPVNASIYDFSDENDYFEVVYARGAQFLMQLRAQMGPDAYMQFIRRYVAIFSDQIAEGGDFISLAQAGSNKPLYPLLRSFLSYNSLQFDGPLPIELQAPDPAKPWNGSVTLNLKTAGLASVQVRANERIVWQGNLNGQGQVQFDTRPLANDDYVLRVIASDESGRTGRAILRFTSLNQPAPAVAAATPTVPSAPQLSVTATAATTVTPTLIPPTFTPTATAPVSPTPSPLPPTPTPSPTLPPPTATPIPTPTATAIVIALIPPTITPLALEQRPANPSGTPDSGRIPKRGDVNSLLFVVLGICLVLLPGLGWFLLRHPSETETGEETKG